MITRAALLTTLRRVVPRGSWRRLGDLIDAAGQPIHVDAHGDFPDHLAFALVVDGYIRVELVPGEPERLFGPGELFDFPGRVVHPNGDGPELRVRGDKMRTARYLRFPDHLLHTFHRACPSGFPEQLPGF